MAEKIAIKVNGRKHEVAAEPETPRRERVMAAATNATVVRPRTLISVIASNGLLHRSDQRRYSITSSARASSVGGTIRPSAFAVLRLMPSLYVVGC